jgi:hypothetical protein
MKYLITGLIILFAARAFCQTDTPITVHPDIYNSFRLGIGIEKNPFIEVGFARLGINEKGLNSGSFCFYASGQLNKILNDSQSDYLYGGKIGFESAWMIGMWGTEVKYLTTGPKSQWFFTPRIGLSLLGSVSLLYGINLPTKSNKLNEVGQHQISLTANLSRRIMKELK